MKTIKLFGLIIMILLYAGAGVNHFWHPLVYESIIPPYLPYHAAINYISGILEITAAVLLVFKNTRKWGAYLIIGLLIVFIPTHIYMIQIAGTENEVIKLPLWDAWLRLFPLQFILIAWAWWHRE